MMIEAIRIRIKTCTDKKFGVDVNFVNNEAELDNFSLIYGKNTLGKTTLIKSIIYALGGEDLYGNTKKTNLSEVIDQVYGEKSVESKIFLQLNNDKERVVIERNALDKYDSVIVYYDTTINGIGSAERKQYLKIAKDYKIESKVLFQDFLFKYFNIPFIREDYSGSAIYFQNLMPLFIITQNSWNDIQANNPYYGVRGIKQLGFEIIMNLSKVEDLKNKIAKEKNNDKIRELNNVLSSYNEVINIFITKNLQENIDKMENIRSEIETLYSEISKLKSLTNNKIDDYESYKDKYSNFCELSDTYSKELIILKKQNSQYEKYIESIEYEIKNLDRLNTAKRLIGSISVTKCPNCFSDITIDSSIDTCSLCGNEFEEIKMAKNHELYKYLIDEKKDFLKLVDNKNRKITAYENKIKLLDLDKEEMEKMMNTIEYDLDGESLKNYSKNVYKLGMQQNELKALTKEQIVLNKIEKIKKQVNDIENIDTKVKKNNGGESISDDDKIHYFEVKFIELLKNLDFIKDGMNRLTSSSNVYDIYIDKNSYKPKIKDKNLYNITSSSGFVRILLSYYVALLETACHYKKYTNHPLILIIDEPKQQNLDNDTYEKFTNILYELCKNNRDIQVIITSGSIGTVKEENIAVNLGKDEYLIKEIE